MIDNPAAKHFPGRAVGLDPASDANFELSKLWLDECISFHPLCGSPSVSQLPTRLIDIGVVTSSRHPFLVIPAAGAKGRYTALSYCWGSSQNEILTTTNLKDKMERIPLSSLVKTIQDAIEITRRLGLQYLWVDALCIIQDSVEDWQKESAVMGNIYQNSVVTIQASGAKDSHMGCFIPRTAQHLAPAKLTFRSVDGYTGSVFVRYQPLVNTNIAEPLHRRAWTLQEGLLSPRLLSWGATQMRWECKTKYYSEGGSLSVEENVLSGLPKPFRMATKSHSPPGDLQDPITQKALTWSYIIRDYSSRQLTFPKDKLPALSGLARYISQTRPGDIYLAGLWKTELPINLLWAIAGNTTRPPSYRAPSWSWASLDGELAVADVWHGPTQDYCEVIDASVTRSSLDSFGEVSGGMITLRGPLKEAWRILDEQALAGEPRVQFLYPDSKPLRPGANAFLSKLGLCELDIFDSNQKLGDPASTWCLQITVSRGLALQCMENGAFQRIGHFVCDTDKANWFKDSDAQTITIV
jgi:Heterokaryon incompatibility protein (HET)